jgi:transposase
VISRLAGHQTARAVIEKMIEGERDPQALAALGQGRMRDDKPPALAEALSGMRFGPQHAHTAASLLRSVDLLDAELRDLQERVTAHLAAMPASWGVDADGVTGPEAGRAADAAAVPAAGRLDEIPGLGREAAAAVIAEIGLDRSRFPTPEALVSRAGLTPTARQSGPRSGRGKKGHGNTYAKRIAVLAAYAAANTTDTFLGERFGRLASRPGGGGRKKAGCAVGRSILIMVWHLLNDPAVRYADMPFRLPFAAVVFFGPEREADTPISGAGGTLGCAARWPYRAVGSHQCLWRTTPTVSALTPQAGCPHMDYPG